MISTACECKAAAAANSFFCVVREIVCSHRLRYLLSAFLLSLQAFASVETWEFRAFVQMPRVADNYQSLGYRKYQTQKLRGSFTVTDDADGGEPTITFCCLYNLTHKVNGESVSYACTVDDVRWHGIGSNLTGDFNTRSVSFRLTAEPSYSAWYEPSDDNTLVLEISGRGNETRLQGYAAGSQGCGCHDYGHTSPTRVWGTSTVVDTAAAYARWQASRRSVK